MITTTKFVYTYFQWINVKGYQYSKQMHKSQLILAEAIVKDWPQWRIIKVYFCFTWALHWLDILLVIAYMDTFKNGERILKQSRNVTHLLAIHQRIIMDYIRTNYSWAHLFPKKVAAKQCDNSNNDNFVSFQILKEPYFSLIVIREWPFLSLNIKDALFDCTFIIKKS